MNWSSYWPPSPVLDQRRIITHEWSRALRCKTQKVRTRAHSKDIIKSHGSGEGWTGSSGLVDANYYI